MFAGKKGPFTAACILGIFLLQGVSLIRYTSPTTDEIPFHMVNGYVYLKTGDYRMNPSSPALIREWMALPWLLIKPKLDLGKPDWRAAETHPFAISFFYGDNRAIADKLLYSSRAMILLLGFGLGLMIYLWARSAYGEAGGLTALALYAFTPGFIAHSALAATDIGTVFCFVAASGALWAYLEKGGGGRFVFFCVCLGLAFAAKINMLVFGPIFLAAASVKKGFRWFLWAAPAAAVLSLACVWASYGFEYKPLLWEGVPRIDEKLEMIGGIARALHLNAESMQQAALHFTIPAPSYVLALGGILNHHSHAQGQYAFGQWGMSHPWYFYWFLFAAKMTPAFLALLAARIWTWTRERDFLRNDHLVLFYPALVYFILICFESTGNGSRYLYPAVAALIVWMGGLAVRARSSFVKKLLAAALIFHAVAGLGAFPDDLGYFNALAGGTAAGPRYARDSDVDWGQGLKPLKKYLEKNKIDEVSLLYFGTADPDFYGLKRREISEAESVAPEPRVYAISARFLDRVQWWKNRRPDAIIAGIFVYDFRDSIRPLDERSR